MYTYNHGKHEHCCKQAYTSGSSQGQGQRDPGRYLVQFRYEGSSRPQTTGSRDMGAVDGCGDSEFGEGALPDRGFPQPSSMDQQSLSYSLCHLGPAANRLRQSCLQGLSYGGRFMCTGRIWFACCGLMQIYIISQAAPAKYQQQESSVYCDVQDNPLTGLGFEGRCNISGCGHDSLSSLRISCTDYSQCLPHLRRIQYKAELDVHGYLARRRGQAGSECVQFLGRRQESCRIAYSCLICCGMPGLKFGGFSIARPIPWPCPPWKLIRMGGRRCRGADRCQGLPRTDRPFLEGGWFD